MTDTTTIQCPECGSFAWYPDHSCYVCEDCGHEFECVETGTALSDEYGEIDASDGGDAE